jgi:hypothetical protein
MRLTFNCQYLIALAGRPWLIFNIGKKMLPCPQSQSRTRYFDWPAQQTYSIPELVSGSAP